MLQQQGGPDRHETADHWADDLAGLLSIMLPPAAAAHARRHVEAAKVAGVPETSKGIRDLIARIASEPQSTDDTRLGVDDLVAAFRVGRHLQTLSRNATPTRALKVQPLCWWTSGRLASRDRLRTQMPAALDRGIIGDNHFTILRETGLLDEIAGLLVPAAAPVVSPDTVSEPAE